MCVHSTLFPPLATPLIITQRPDTLQVVKRQTLGDLSSAREFRTSILFLSSGVLESGAAHIGHGRRDGHPGHFDRASPTNTGTSQRPAPRGIQTCSRTIRRGDPCRKDRQAHAQLHLRLRVGERDFSLSREYGPNEFDCAMVREFLVEN